MPQHKQPVSPADGWRRASADLAAWAMAFLVNRTDAWGQYLALNRRKVTPRPDGTTRVETATTRKGLVTEALLKMHFAGGDVAHLIGLHSTSTQNLSRWLVVEWDKHRGDDADPARNLQQARTCLQWLEDRRLHGILEDSNGLGGYHVWLVFSTPLPTPRLFAFAGLMFAEVGFRAHETFPKQASITNFGNWLRLPGRHHTEPHWSKIWDGFGWAEGTLAASQLLGTPLNDPKAVPAIDAPSVPPASPLPLPRRRDPAVTYAWTPWAELSDREKAVRALPYVRMSHVDSYPDWLLVGQVLYDLDPGPDMLAAWDSWSRGSPKYAERACAAKWAGFGRGRPARPSTVGTLIHWANESPRFRDERRPPPRTFRAGPPPRARKM